MTLDHRHRPALIRALNLAGAALERAGLGLVPLDEVRLLGEARRQAGLGDFGDDSFREPLPILLEAYNTEAKLNLVGRLGARFDTLRLLVNRLLLHEDWKRHPGIAEQAIRRPLFITGLPRTGTTLLHGLLAQDPGNRAPRAWEVMYPSPPPERAHFESDPRIAKAEKQMRWFDRLAPEFKTIHSLSARLPQECIEITSYAFASPRFHTTHSVPSYKAWLDHHDLRSAYRFHRRFLQHLQWRSPAERWVLKAPAHLFGLDALFETYPDALIIQCHRDPLTVLGSVASLTAVLYGAFSDCIDLMAIGTEVTHRWAEGVERAMRFRERGLAPRDRFLDVHYHDLLRDPIATVRRVYAHFELVFTREAEARMRRFLAENAKDKHGVHGYSLIQFGLDPEEEDRRYKAYRDCFGIEPEYVDAR